MKTLSCPITLILTKNKINLKLNFEIVLNAIWYKKVNVDKIDEQRDLGN